MLLGSLAAVEAAQYPKIAVYVGGKPAQFYSLMDEPIVNALLVDGQPMVAARFMSAALKDELDIHLLPIWGFFKVDRLEFKLGARKVYRYVPMMAGGAAQGWDLPMAPRTISGRLYLPALPTLRLLGHKPQWDPQQRSLRVVLRTGPTDYEF